MLIKQFLGTALILLTSNHYTAGYPFFCDCKIVVSLPIKLKQLLSSQSGANLNERESVCLIYYKRIIRAFFV